MEQFSEVLRSFFHHAQAFRTVLFRKSSIQKILFERKLSIMDHDIQF
jgi:hypothetical protein